MILRAYSKDDSGKKCNGTYFPARDGDRGATVGFLTFLKKIKESYHAKQDLVTESGRLETERCFENRYNQSLQIFIAIILTK
jgi:hypothetical protein